MLFATHDDAETVVLVHVGRSLCVRVYLSIFPLLWTRLTFNPGA